MSSVRQTWTIEGVEREAYCYVPAGTGLPILIAFHGHNGSGKGFAAKNFEATWQDCIVVYPTGLPTKSGGDPSGTESGWQHSVGEVNNATGIKDQDLKLFDAILATFQSQIDPAKIFVHGWSNGGEFVYDVLWTVRGDNLRGISCAAAILNTTTNKKPLPVFHIAGESDPVVRFSAQQNCTANIRILNQCLPNGVEWATGDYGTLATKWASKIACPVIFTQYAGEHGYPDTIPSLLTRFFKNQR